MNKRKFFGGIVLCGIGGWIFLSVTASGQTEDAQGLMAPLVRPETTGTTAGIVSGATTAVQTNEVDALASRGLELLASGQLQAAESVFKQALRKDKSHRKALFGLGTTYIEMRRYKEAETVLLELLRQYPGAVEGLNNLAWMYATASDPAYRKSEKALRYAQDAVLLQPNAFELWNTLSEAYYVLGEYDKAKRAAEQALRLSIEKGAPQRVVGDYRRQLEKCTRAAEALSIVD